MVSVSPIALFNINDIEYLVSVSETFSKINESIPIKNEILSDFYRRTKLSSEDFSIKASHSNLFYKWDYAEIENGIENDDTFTFNPNISTLYNILTDPYPKSNIEIIFPIYENYFAPLIIKIIFKLNIIGKIMQSTTRITLNYEYVHELERVISMKNDEIQQYINKQRELEYELKIYKSKQFEYKSKNKINIE